MDQGDDYSNYADSPSTGSSGKFDYGSAAGGIGAAVGLGFSAFGAYNQYTSAQKQASISQNIIGLEQQAEGQRRTAMELQARRQNMQILRQNQVARAMATQNATGQGAQYGTGLSAGLSQVQGQTGVNLSGLSQNLQIGENMFDINAQISQQKIAMSQAKAQEAEGAGISSFGKSLGGSITPLFNLGRQLAPLLFA